MYLIFHLIGRTVVRLARCQSSPETKGVCGSLSFAVGGVVALHQFKHHYATVPVLLIVDADGVRGLTARWRLSRQGILNIWII
jgi:hypothetical protein